MTEIKFRFVVAVNRVVNHFGDKAKHLFGGRVLADVIVFAGDNQRASDAFENLKFAVAVKPNFEHANVRAAEVQRKIFAGFFAARKSDVRFQHAH